MQSHANPRTAIEHLKPSHKIVSPHSDVASGTYQAAGLVEPPVNVNTVVIVGNKISPRKTVTKPDGIEVRTLWGEIAWQLGGKEGYQMMQQAEQTSTNSGNDLIL